MATIFQKFLNEHQTKTTIERKNLLKQIMQETALCGLSRTDFFKKVAFYGGTALRIFHNLDRFSEDLDFVLLSPDPNFDFSFYFEAIEKEMKAIGFNVKVVIKPKKFERDVKTAFLIGDAKELLNLVFGSISKSDASRDELIRVKMDVNINPSLGATYETKESLFPFYHTVNLYDLPSLFTGKICACLTRGWRHRIKGRDFYDFIFFVKKGIKFNLNALKAKLVKAEAFKESEDLTLEKVKNMLKERFEKVDYEAAKQDVLLFINNNSEQIDLWNKELFLSLTDRLKNQQY